MVRLFGMLPGPIVVGQIFDTTCSVWKYNSCGERTSCAEYDMESLSRQMMFVSIFGNGKIAFVFSLITAKLIKIRDFISLYWRSAWPFNFENYLLEILRPFFFYFLAINFVLFILAYKLYKEPAENGDLKFDEIGHSNPALVVNEENNIKDGNKTPVVANSDTNLWPDIVGFVCKEERPFFFVLDILN